MKSKRYVAVAVLMLAIASGYFVWRALGTMQSAPAVTYTLLDGSRTAQEHLRGKVVLVNFWATTCSTCVHEMPQLIATHEKYKSRGYETVAVAMKYDPPAYVMNFAESKKLPFPVALDNTGELAKSFGNVAITPTTFLINKRGEIVKRYVGEPNFAALHSLVDQLLAES